jgi:polyisoprenyl-phosphate glycosyltransferase
MTESCAWPSGIPFPIGSCPKLPERHLSVVVACFNEALVLDELHQRLTDACETVVGNDFDIVLVNDGSTDDTWSRIRDLAARDGRVFGISLSRNHGHQLALTAGLRLCRGQRVLVIDADLQDPPELLIPMMQLMDSGADVVYGQRTQRDGETWFKKLSAALFYRLLTRLTHVKIPRDTGDFRLMRRRVVDALNVMPEHHRFIRGMVSWIGFRQVPIRYERSARFAGQSHYPIGKMLRFSVDAITAFSVVPLRIASALGLGFGIAGLSGLVYAFASWMSGQTVPGWTSVIVTVLILGSAQLLMLGILGEYVGRLYMESKRRPLFIADEIIHMPEDAADKGMPQAMQSKANPRSPSRQEH